jgi:hypothetical protein
MPKIQRAEVPPRIIQHLLQRARERAITLQDIQQILRWIETNPTVPNGDWFKRFSGVTVCGQGALVKTLLTPQQTAIGTEVL